MCTTSPTTGLCFVTSESFISIITEDLKSVMAKIYIKIYIKNAPYCFTALLTPLIAVSSRNGSKRNTKPFPRSRYLYDYPGAGAALQLAVLVPYPNHKQGEYAYEFNFYQHNMHAK